MIRFRVFTAPCLLITGSCFFDSENVTSLAFVIVVVFFKFFKYRVCCCDYVTSFAVWGWLFGFYLNIIYETAFEIDKLPEINLGTSITFFVVHHQAAFSFFDYSGGGPAAVHYQVLYAERTTGIIF